jgi:uncharacterized protein (DUF427 family)
MPYTTSVAGTTITASWANANVRDQVVTPFASTSALASAITAPVVGMATYISSNDANEGLLTRSSANQWRLPWNMPWGRVASSATGTATSSGVSGSLADVGPTASFTAVANRRYKVSVSIVRIAAPATACTVTTVLVNGSASPQQYLSFNSVAANGLFSVSSVGEFTGIAAGAYTFKIQGTTDIASAATYQSGTYGSTIIVEDIGPAGAPA